MNKQFNGYVTSVSFNLSLTRSQIQTISHLRDGSDDMFEYPHLISSLRALKRRGLVNENKSTSLTDAGIKVAELLVIAGLIAE